MSFVPSAQKHTRCSKTSHKIGFPIHLGFFFSFLKKPYLFLHCQSWQYWEKHLSKLFPTLQKSKESQNTEKQRKLQEATLVHYKQSKTAVVEQQDKKMLPDAEKRKKKDVCVLSLSGLQSHPADVGAISPFCWMPGLWIINNHRGKKPNKQRKQGLGQARLAGHWQPSCFCLAALYNNSLKVEGEGGIILFFQGGCSWCRETF